MIVKGQKINDRYEILKLIGEGGMANVYLANDTILDRQVAIKVLRGDLSNDEKFVRRFQREALAASSLSHSNIVEIYDVGEDDGSFYIVMEYIEGKTLKQLIKKRGVLSLSESMDIMLQLLDALSQAHDSYIIHRDIKPQNIMIKENGLVKITDFGIAMALNRVELTQTNSVMGSVHYLPPEQASGKGSTIRSDIYSLGILMYEMLTGKMPFRGDSAVEIALKHMKESLPSPKEINPILPQAVENIIIKAAAKNPKNRYKDVREMADDIRTCLDDERQDEEVIKFKYPESDFSDTKVTTIKEKKENTKEIEKPVIKQIDENTNVDEKDNSKKKLIIICSIIAIFAVVLFSIIIIYPAISSKAVKEIKVPDVYGMEISEAESKLKKEGLSFESIEKNSDSVDKNLVIETSPSKNRYVKKGTIIKIYYSVGSKKISIENYTGQNVYDIKAKLNLDGIVVEIEEKEIENVDDYKGKEQLIISQSVNEGEKISSGSKITLFIPKMVIKYPDFVADNWEIKRIEEYSEKYGIKLEIVPIYDNTKEVGTILSQRPKANEEVFEGDVLKIGVVKHEEETTKPEVTTTKESTTTTKGEQ